MKTLANCSDVEFLRQTNKIRKTAESWIKNTGVSEIRSRQMPKAPDNLSADERREFYRNVIHDRLNEMLDKALDEHADETVRLLRMLCFIEPDDEKSLRAPVLLKHVSEIMDCQEVLDFFTSLGRLGLMNTETPVK